MTISKIGRTLVVLVFSAATEIASPAQTFKTLVGFDGINGRMPEYMSLVQGYDGNLYGTTISGGANNGGSVFKITPGGKLTPIYSFCAQTNCADGGGPHAGLVLATDGNFYGTTAGGGTNTYCDNFGCGTVFRLTPSGKLTTLYNFCAQTNCTDGTSPYSALVQGTDGNFYGATLEGGKTDCLAGEMESGCGTVFKITPDGKLATLHRFDSSDGGFPMGALVESADGNFYGTTSWGGLHDCGGDMFFCGTVFKVTPSGKLTVLYEFSGGTDGGPPYAGLIQAVDRSFYGTNVGGNIDEDGTIFKITQKGKLTTLYTFSGGSDEGWPEAPLIQALDGNLYGTTCGCNETQYGTVFKFNPYGTLTTLHSFDNSDGANPDGGLFQATSGVFYGSTYGGGGLNCDNGYACGTLFSLSVGLKPFVQTVPTAGKVGTKVVILGTNLTGATSVTFNGTAAKFTVISKSEIKTSVPSGATSGTVKVKTPRGTLQSNVDFRLLR